MQPMQPRLPKRLRDLVQVALTYNRVTGELLIRGIPRDEDMVRFVVNAAGKMLRQSTVRHSITKPMPKLNA